MATAPLSMVNALPQYRVGAQIGSGGMGEVYSGVHRTLGRHVAIKQLPPEVADRARANVQFDREARVLASLDHPHIVPVYDYVQNLLVMEKLDGGTVFDRFHEGGIDKEQACAITLAMLSGLHAAHTAGVLHLDVKPKNLLFNMAGLVKVADFGIAQVISEGATLVTHGGQILGTPAYIAPEQAMGSTLSPAADVYAAGTVLYEMLSGELPFDRASGALALIRQHIFADPKRIEAVGEPLATVVMRSVARELSSRYTDAESFAVDLAAAATTVYGEGWLERSGVPVLGLSPRVAASLATGSAAREELTVVTKAGDPALADQSAEPDRPKIPALVAAIALLGVIAVALLAPFRLSHDEQAGATIQGTPGAGPVVVDLSKPVTISGTGGVSGPVEMRIRGASIPLGSATSPAITPGPDGSFTTKVTLPPVARWIVGGTVSGEVSWQRESGLPAVQTFTVVVDQHPMASAMGTGSLLLGLFALAYVESTVRTLRRGYYRPAARYTALILGALFGIATWMLISVLSGNELSLYFGIACAAAGAVSASSAIIATERAAALRVAARRPV
ncbi:serine/threonine-protein kinase [Kibdelosporangium banguiense]|uniref:non-specific serine/threonine protein kinase n=1 Tax=Kibdelosporangium banguiense TaxID=1365924 RepID=A0ABS4TLK7_9PSEU|nr:serine/threonine-protein kinase [Kibdelosporangium banguiense]MBP2325287.1 serine/threonine-protein kinase [Kibdelosporangium banguiense]